MQQPHYSRVLIALAYLLTACYSTVPVQSGQPRLGTDIVIQLNDPGTTEMARLVGPQVIRIEGRALADERDTLVVAVSSTTRSDGEETFWKRERIGTPHSFIAMIQQKKLSTVRSGAVGLAIVAATLAIRSAVLGSNSGPPGGNPPPRQ